MGIGSFDRLHEEVSQALGASVRPLRHGGTGSRFTFVTAGREATVVHQAQRGIECALVMVSLGTVPPCREEAALAELAQANFAWMMQEPALAGSRHGATGELFIQYAYPLGTGETAEFLARIQAIAAWSDSWDRLYATCSRRQTDAPGAPCTLCTLP